LAHAGGYSRPFSTFALQMRPLGGGLLAATCGLGGETVNYIDEGFYKQHGIADLDGLDLGRLIERACGIVDGLTYGRVRAKGLEGLTGFQADGVRRACVLIVDHLAGVEREGVADVVAYSLHGMRVQMAQRRIRPWQEANCGKEAWGVLTQTGLMRKGF